MSRKTKRLEEEEQDLDLAPIMNMVIILIPLLLLSVVFLQVGVINVTAPALAPAESTQKTDPEPKQKITVAIGASGFTVATREGVVRGCGEVTVCMREGSEDVLEQFERAAELLGAGDHAAGQAQMDRALDGFDWPGLYAVLARVKRDNPEEDTIHVSADSNIPYAALVKLFDVSRTRLADDRYDTLAALESAPPAAPGAELFPNPILGIVQ